MSPSGSTGAPASSTSMRPSSPSSIFRPGMSSPFFRPDFLPAAVRPSLFSPVLVPTSTALPKNVSAAPAPEEPENLTKSTNAESTDAEKTRESMTVTPPLPEIIHIKTERSDAADEMDMDYNHESTHPESQADSHPESHPESHPDRNGGDSRMFTPDDSSLDGYDSSDPNDGGAHPSVGGGFGQLHPHDAHDATKDELSLEEADAPENLSGRRSCPSAASSPPSTPFHSPAFPLHFPSGHFPSSAIQFHPHASLRLPLSFPNTFNSAPG